jgi:tryptophan-rich sensory protein
MAKLILFFVLNFAALAIGSLLMGNPASNTWYQNANIAPWTPPGWVFGAAWFSIMICFSFFMYIASVKFPFNKLKSLYVLYAIQWLLNVIWSPLFFKYHFILFSLIIIISLTVLMIWFSFWGFKHLQKNAILVLPYSIWLIIATSLNAYIYFNN